MSFIKSICLNRNILESNAEVYKKRHTDKWLTSFFVWENVFNVITEMNFNFYCVEVTSSLDQSINPQSRSLFLKGFISKSGKLSYTPVEPSQKPSLV